MELQTVVVCILSLGILSMLFSSLQGSDVSSMDGIIRRRLPNGVLEGFGSKEQAFVNFKVSKTWLAEQSQAGSSEATAQTGKRRKNDKKKDKYNEELCNVNPAPKGVYVKGHGPCITQFPHQPASFGGMDDCWRMVFAVAQWKQPHNPRKAEYGDDWRATAKAYPHTAAQAQQVVDDLNTKTDLPVSTEWSAEHPYVRLCIPTKCGLSKRSGCDLKKTDFLMHINPNHQDTDNTTHLFYKGFIRNGHIMLPNVGLTGH
jgi:hypothetical protein